MSEKNCRILLAEDDPGLRAIMLELLRGENFICEDAADGIEAKEKLEMRHFDILITDFQMPRMNGVELLFWCRKQGLHLPVIFLSANIDRLPMEELALNDCCSSLLMKPVRIDDLLEAIEKARNRIHEFECEGKIFPLDGKDDSHFPGQHIQCEKPATKKKP